VWKLLYTGERNVPLKRISGTNIDFIGYILKAGYGWQHVSMTSFVFLGGERIKNIR
jgi:hypothetical protein